MRDAYNERVKPRADDFLPLRAVEYHVLLALADEERHGYAIMQETAERTGGGPARSRPRSIARCAAW